MMKINSLACILNARILNGCRALHGAAFLAASCALALTAPTAANDSLGTVQSASSGIAIYASYLDADLAAEASRKLEQTLQHPVQLSEAQVDGNLYLRLQSEPVAPEQARALVTQARAAGYGAWFAGAASHNAQPVAYAQQYQDQSITRQDISHLNLAITEAIPSTTQEVATSTSTTYTASSFEVSAAESLPLAQTIQTNRSLRKGSSPELEQQLPNGPLLGDIYPPRSPLQR